MALVQYLPSNQISSITGYNYIAELRYGANGEMYSGTPELSTGTATNRTAENVMWDEYPDDGIDSGWLSTGCFLQSGAGGLRLSSVNSDGKLAYNVGTLSGINSVTLRAGVQNQAAMLWHDVWVRFYRDGTLQESISLGDLGVDNTQIPGGATSEQVIRVQPTLSGNTKVEVLGLVRFVSPEGVWLEPYDAFSQIFAYTSSGTGGMNMLSSPSASLLGSKTTSMLAAQPLTSADTGGKYTGEAFTVVPLSSYADDELLAVETAPDTLISAEPSLLA